MALDRVANEILDNAGKEAEQRVQMAEIEKAKILQDADQNIEKMRKAEEKDLEDTLTRMRRQELSSAELEAKKIVLNKQKDILNRTFEETLAELSSMNPKDKSALYKKILADGRRSFTSPRCTYPWAKPTCWLASGDASPSPRST